MLEKVIGLFERLVVAVEKNAEHNAIIAASMSNPEAFVAAPPKAEEKPKATRNSKKAEPEAPKQEPEAPKQEAPKVEAPKIALVDVKKAVSEYAAARMAAGSSDPKGDARALMAQHADGATKTDDIKEIYFSGIINACQTGWVPAAAEEDL